MPEQKESCRYCDREPVDGFPLPSGEVPLCEVHARDLSDRLARDLDRVMGQPVHYDRINRPAADQPAGDGKPAKADPSF